MQRTLFQNVVTRAIVAVASLAMTAASAHASLVISVEKVSGTFLERNYVIGT